MDAITLENKNPHSLFPRLKSPWPVTVCSAGLIISFFLPWFSLHLDINLLFNSIHKSFTANGWDIVKELTDLSNQLNTTQSQDFQILQYSPLMYLTVVFAGINIILDLVSVRRLTLFLFNEFLWGIASLAYLLYLIFLVIAYIYLQLHKLGLDSYLPDLGSNTWLLNNYLASLGAGFWSMVVFSVVGGILSFFVPKSKKKNFKAFESQLKKQSDILSNNDHRNDYPEGVKETTIDNTLQPDAQPERVESLIFSVHRDKISQLKQIKALLDSGVLTQEEFDKEKTKILS